MKEMSRHEYPKEQMFYRIGGCNSASVSKGPTYAQHLRTSSSFLELVCSSFSNVGAALLEQVTDRGRHQRDSGTPWRNWNAAISACGWESRWCAHEDCRLPEPRRSRYELHYHLHHPLPGRSIQRMAGGGCTCRVLRHTRVPLRELRHDPHQSDPQFVWISVVRGDP